MFTPRTTPTIPTWGDRTIPTTNFTGRGYLGGAWKELIKIYDSNAINQATNGTMKNSVKPRKVKVTK